MTAITQDLSKGILAKRSWILGLIFLYFFTSSADLLNIQVFLFRCKANHFLAFLLFFFFSLERKKWMLPEKKFFFAFLATVFVMCISSFAGTYPSRSFMYLLVYLFTFVVYFILPFNLLLTYGKETVLKLYFAAFFATGIIGALQFFLSFFGIIAPFVEQFVGNMIARAQAMSYEPSYFALYLIPYVMYHNARFLFDVERILDFSKLRSLFLKNLFLLISTSTGAFFAYFVFFFIIILSIKLSWLKSNKRRLVKNVFKLSIIFILFFSCIALTMPVFFITSFWKFFATGFAHWSFTERWDGITTALKIFYDHPVFGIGVGGYGPLLYQQLYCQDRQIDFHEPYRQMFDEPMNAFSELLASLGCVGLIAFIWMFYNYFRYLSNTAKIYEITKEEKSTIYSLIISVCVMLIALQFNQNLFRSYVWIHFAICIGYACSIRLKYEKQ